MNPLAALADFVGYAEFSCGENHDAPSVWKSYRTILLSALFADTAGKRVDDISDLLGCCDAEFIKGQERIRELGCCALDAVSRSSPRTDDPMLVSPAPYRRASTKDRRFTD